MAVSVGARFGRRRAEPVLAADCWPEFWTSAWSTLETQEGSAYGAALLALVGAGSTGRCRKSAARRSAKSTLRQPRPEEVEAV